jgi:hypothetical protein
MPHVVSVTQNYMTRICHAAPQNLRRVPGNMERILLRIYVLIF